MNRKPYAVVFLLSSVLVIASCTVQYRRVGVNSYTRVVVPASEQLEDAELCVRDCQAARFLPDQGLPMTQALFPFPAPTSDEDCQARLPGSIFNSEDGSCLVGNNEDAYRLCLETCPQVVVEAGRCQASVLATSVECAESYVAVEWVSEETGSCASWYEEFRSGQRSVAEGEEPWCQDWEQRHPLAIPGLVVLAVLAVAVVVVAAFAFGADYSFRF